MNKSQLRKLAREFALGKLDEEVYRQKRRDLIGGIVNGSIAIVREAPPPPPPPPQANESTIETELEIEPGGFRVSPVYVGIGVAVVAVLVWLFYPSGEPEESETEAALEQPLPVPQVSPARVLVEEFVAARDWSDFGIARFKETWNGLSQADRAEALTSRWFNDLTNALSEELKTQNALLDFDESGNAAGTGRRLADFAEFLGVADNVTEFKGKVAASGSNIQSPPPQPAPQPAPPTTTPESVASVTPTAASPAPDSRVSSRRTVRTVSGASWLDGQPAEAFTLQLFAVNHLEKIQQLIAANPDVDLQVLVSAHSEPRYRVIHGAFDSADQARAAHAALPASIRQAQPTPMVKTIGALRKDVSNGDWIASLDASQYTLQLFATDNSDNARRFVMKYPALSLSLLDTTDSRSRYRVLYGAFESEASAKQAAGSLPSQLLRDAGNPLVKSVSELQAARR